MSGETNPGGHFAARFCLWVTLAWESFFGCSFFDGLFLLQRPKPGNAAADTSLPALILRSLSIRKRDVKSKLLAWVYWNFYFIGSLLALGG